jgi:hypothetical protein
MRTFILTCVVAIAVGAVAFTVHSDMIHASAPTGKDVMDVKGKITEVMPEKEEFSVSENFKNWKFTLAKNGKVTLNGRDSKLSELQPGDQATVSYDRQGQLMIATMVRTTRK